MQGWQQRVLIDSSFEKIQTNNSEYRNYNCLHQWLCMCSFEIDIYVEPNEPNIHCNIH